MPSPTAHFQFPWICDTYIIHHTSYDTYIITRFSRIVFLAMDVFISAIVHSQSGQRNQKQEVGDKVQTKCPPTKLFPEIKKLKKIFFFQFSVCAVIMVTWNKVYSSVLSQKIVKCWYSLDLVQSSINCNNPHALLSWKSLRYKKKGVKLWWICISDQF